MALLAALEQRVIAPPAPGLFWIIDGKPLPVGGCTKDRQARYGRAAGGYAKGYKLHVGQHLLQERECIERAFAHLTNWSSGLTGMPPWVRTHRRVHRWVQAKLILTALKRLTHATTYVK